MGDSRETNKNLKYKKLSYWQNRQKEPQISRHGDIHSSRTCKFHEAELVCLERTNTFIDGTAKGRLGR